MNSKESFFVIDAEKKQNQYCIELFKHWELLLFFVWRDILVRYKQALIGISWAIIRPFLNMVAFSFFFGTLAKLPSDHIPYSVFVLAGLLPWQFFSNSINETCMSLINNTSLISKIFFPRMILPISQILVQVVDFGINFIFFISIALFYSSLSFRGFFVLPYFIMVNLVLCIGCGFWFSALTVKWRDVRFIVPFIIQFGMLISPVGYGSFVITGPLKWVYFLNPMVGVIDGFRFAFFGMTHEDFLLSISLSSLMTLFIFLSGFFFFRKEETLFADRI